MRVNKGKERLNTLSKYCPKRTESKIIAPIWKAIPAYFKKWVRDDLFIILTSALRLPCRPDPLLEGRASADQKGGRQLVWRHFFVSILICKMMLVSYTGQVFPFQPDLVRINRLWLLHNYCKLLARSLARILMKCYYASNYFGLNDSTVQAMVIGFIIVLSRPKQKNMNSVAFI